MLRTTGTFISAILFSRFPLYAHHVKLPSANHIEDGFSAFRAFEHPIPDIKRKITLVTAGRNRNRFDLNFRPGSHGIAAHQVEAKSERLGNHGRKLSDSEPDLVYAPQLMPLRLIDNDIKKTLGNGEFVHGAILPIGGRTYRSHNARFKSGDKVTWPFNIPAISGQ
jgi:hypothetical protein